jgi:RNA polymerase sigma-70 factor (ECF subfamily)
LGSVGAVCCRTSKDLTQSAQRNGGEKSEKCNCIYRRDAENAENAENAEKDEDDERFNAEGAEVGAHRTPRKARSTEREWAGQLVGEFGYHLLQRFGQVAVAQAHMPSSPAGQFVSIEVARGLLQKGAAPAEWNLTAERFRLVLERSVAHRFTNATSHLSGGASSHTHSNTPSHAPPDARAIQAYMDSLHAADLALACACSDGNAAAWDFFMARFRPELYRAGWAIAGESGGRELADSLYAELYGLREVAGQRKSLFDYFLGRSKLTTWLHAILAQRHVDGIRRARRTDALEEGEAGEHAYAAQQTSLANSAASSPDPERNRFLAILQAVLTAALNALAPRDRLRLAYYYVEGLTLAEIGRLVGEHEATVSRKLERTRREIRKHVEGALRQEKKLSAAQLQLCYEYAREEWPFDLTRALSPGE